MNILKKPEFWQESWKKALEDSLWKKRKKDKDNIWNEVARTYEQDKKTIGKSRLDAVIEFLEAKGVLDKNFIVLDIGCGPGVYALPMALKVKEVVALDSAEKMCAVLAEKAKEAGLSNIATLVLPWEELNLDRLGWRGYFDLVFASITPAIRDPETFLKMISASRKYCCLIEFAWGYYSPAFVELWPLIFKEDYPGSGFEIIYPLNLLLASGYLPELYFIEDFWEEEKPVEEAVSRLCRSFKWYTEITPEVEQIITGYVQSHSRNGLYCRSIENYLGILLWRVDERRRNLRCRF